MNNHVGYSYSLQPEEAEKLKSLINQILFQYKEEKSKLARQYDNDDIARLRWLIQQVVNHVYDPNGGQYRRVIYAIESLANKLNLI